MARGTDGSSGRGRRSIVSRRVPTAATGRSCRVAPVVIPGGHLLALANPDGLSRSTPDPEGLRASLREHPRTSDLIPRPTGTMTPVRYGVWRTTRSWLKGFARSWTVRRGSLRRRCSGTGVSHQWEHGHRRQWSGRNSGARRSGNVRRSGRLLQRRTGGHARSPDGRLVACRFGSSPNETTAHQVGGSGRRLRPLPSSEIGNPGRMGGSTVRPDGSPHVTPLLGVWLDGAMQFCTGPNERNSQNLAENRHCMRLRGSQGPQRPTWSYTCRSEGSGP